MLETVNELLEKLKEEHLSASTCNKIRSVERAIAKAEGTKLG